ncbi:hypothetical protein DPMN_149395 [Dreissena polymorpha]|uniref:B box-type domain-containing protein n=1 Tax=Dreissena polymorpha TaxID=45954 RepID=A0A9D4FB99_DREPO|nr:hypothetical protein DPMN_149395 [Dreissena polymorpha]
MVTSKKSKFSLQKGSDLIYDFCCTVCEENGAYNKEVEAFCEQCFKCYCVKYVGLHNRSFNKHSLALRNELHKWTEIKAKVDALEKCPEHKNDVIKSLCEDHQQLLCHDCLQTKHR